MEFISKSLEDTKEVARKVVSGLKPSGGGATIIGLYGELGSGKTTFMKYFAEALGVEEEIQSPTFVIMKFFNIPGIINGLIFNKLVHIDAYRLDSGQDLLKLGWKELVSDPKNLICIEWPERIADILEKDHVVLRFEHVEDPEQKGGREGERKISIA